MITDSNISSRLSSVYLAGTVNGIPRPSLTYELQGWADEGQFLNAAAVRTMEVKPTADGRKQQWAVPSLTTITVNLSPTSPNWAEFSQVLQEQSGYGSAHVVTAWYLSLICNGYKVIGREGTLTEGSIFPNLSVDRLDVLPFTFEFITGTVNVLPL